MNEFRPFFDAEICTEITLRMRYISPTERVTPPFYKTRRPDQGEEYMRVGLMMRDTEYRDAMIEMLSGYDKDIFVEVAGPSGVSREAVILTDILPTEIENKSLEKIRKRTVFLSPAKEDNGIPDKDKSRPVMRDKPYDGIIHTVFKYCSLDTILAELSLVYSLWSGNTGSISPATRIIAVTGESDHLSGSRCRSLAGQILYRHGGSVLIMPLGYVSDHIGEQNSDDRGWFRRLMYLIDEGKEYMPESFTYTDSYGISYLRLPGGINPLTALDTGYLERLIASIGSRFDTLILDIGSCYSASNLRVLDKADNILFFGNGRRIDDPSRYMGEKVSGRIRKIGISDAGAETLSIDDFVNEIYGRTDQKKDNTEIQRRDR